MFYYTLKPDRIRNCSPGIELMITSHTIDVNVPLMKYEHVTLFVSQDVVINGLAYD